MAKNGPDFGRFGDHFSDPRPAFRVAGSSNHLNQRATGEIRTRDLSFTNANDSYTKPLLDRASPLVVLAAVPLEPLWAPTTVV